MNQYFKLLLVKKIVNCVKKTYGNNQKLINLYLRWLLLKKNCLYLKVYGNIQ